MPGLKSSTKVKRNKALHLMTLIHFRYEKAIYYFDIAVIIINGF